jgi:hypothetical protein
LRLAVEQGLQALQPRLDFVVDVVGLDHCVLGLNLIAAQRSDHFLLELDVCAEDDAEVLGAVHRLDGLL